MARRGQLTEWAWVWSCDGASAGTGAVVRRIIDGCHAVEGGEEVEDCAIGRYPRGLAYERLVAVGQRGVSVPHPDQHLVWLLASRLQDSFMGRGVECYLLDHGHELFRRHDHRMPREDCPPPGDVPTILSYFAPVARRRRNQG